MIIKVQNEPPVNASVGAKNKMIQLNDYSANAYVHKTVNLQKGRPWSWINFAHSGIKWQNFIPSTVNGRP